MRKWMIIALGLAAASWPAAADVEQNENIEKTFQVAGAPKLIVDNVNGSIQVTGHAGSEVRLVAHKHVRADSQEKAEEARRDVKLDMSQEGGTVRLYVDGPFRCRDGGVHVHGRQGYEVTYDFELQVPAAAAIDLKTINGGHIAVQDVAGDYQVENINGGIGWRRWRAPAACTR